MHCTHCGHEAGTEARFCRDCGQPLEAPVIGEADFYKAAIGPNNTAYYLQRFAEFDRRGKAGIGWHWPAFNVADSAITCGAALLIWDGLFPGGASKDVRK